MTYKPQYEYIPPAGWHAVTKLYDIFCIIAGLGKSFKRKIAESVQLHNDAIIADIGCGTGIFLEVIKKRYPNAKIIGIDPDKKALKIAKSHLKQYSFEVELIQAFAESLPLDSNSVDACFSTLALHHMPDEIKYKALEEMYRILKDGGQIIIADFGKTNSWFMKKFLFFEEQEYIKSNFEGLIPQYLERVGFKNVRIVSKKFPSIKIFIAVK